MAPIIKSEDELRDVLKAPLGAVTAKIRSGPLGNLANRFLAHVRLGVVTTLTPDGSPHVFAVGGEAGFVTQDPADGRLVVPLPARSRHDCAASEPCPGFAGMLLMVPGVKHTLRVNGAAATSDNGGSLMLTPGQSYPHCAKAFIRSELWNATTEPSASSPIAGLDPTIVDEHPRDHLHDSAIEFIAASPFAAIGTSLAGSDADVSPRGDPPGFVHVVDKSHLFIPERPGNRIADSLRNIIANPTAAVLFMVPGDPRVLEIVGGADVTDDAELRSACEVNGKIPKLGVLITVRDATLGHAPALAASEAWNPASHASESDLPTIGALVADPDRERSMTRRAMTGIADRAVQLDYGRNLY